MKKSKFQNIAELLQLQKVITPEYDLLIKRCNNKIQEEGYEFKDDNKFVSDLLDKFQENEVDHFTDMGYSVEEYFNEKLNLLSNPHISWWVELSEKFLVKI